ncbi:MAG: 23S rRNA (guanosine(2251)-2'-O)-methyltransferase RlmB, partial [Arachnia sp.]
HQIPFSQVPRGELDKITGGLVQQGVALQLPAFEYAEVDDVLDAAASGGIVVALDSVTDPRNLGAIIRSAAAFGATGIILPKRRSASMTATAWKASAGAAARLPVAVGGNINRMLERACGIGFTIIGLAGEAELPISSASTDGPVVLVVGSEGEGLSRLVREHCDALVTIPISGTVESLNASVAAAIALYEIGQQRGLA